jgi:hypothetical protein
MLLVAASDCRSYRKYFEFLLPSIFEHLTLQKYPADERQGEVFRRSIHKLLNVQRV